MTDTALTDGIIQQDGEKVSLRFERRLTHPIDRVWAALTEPDQLIAWWGEATVELVPGGEFSLRWLNTDADGNSFAMHHTIAELAAPRLLVTTGQEHGTLRWELTEDGPAATVLRFSSTLNEQYPVAQLASFLTGWHMHLDYLANALTGGKADLVNIPGWEKIHERYQTKLA